MPETYTEDDELDDIDNVTQPLNNGTTPWFEQSGINTWVSCDVDGDASADFQILCAGVITFTADDFLL